MPNATSIPGGQFCAGYTKEFIGTCKVYFYKIHYFTLATGVYPLHDKATKTYTCLLYFSLYKQTSITVFNVL